MNSRIVDFPLSHFVGFVTDLRTTLHAPNDIRAIPSLWQSLSALLPSISKRVGEEKFVYITGDVPGALEPVARYHGLIQVSAPSQVPGATVALSLGPAKLAKFSHRGQPHTIGSIAGPAFHEWLPQSGYQLATSAELIILPPGYDRNDPQSVVDYCIFVR
jgi:predicted transcriptional regulator YdeE